MKCGKCGHLNDEDAGFCESCGSPLESICPHCGAPLKPGASFCKMCGKAVSGQKSGDEEKDSPNSIPPAAPAESNKKARLSAAQVEGERKPTTILFADIVGSTSLAEKIDPEEWKEVVSGAHQRIIQVVHRYEGTIAQLLGDGVLAFFGAPVTHEDDPVRAVQAAMDIQRKIGKYALELKGYIDNFQLRVGLNSGMVVAGAVGSELHMEYLAVGDAVNLAARMQSAAQPGQVLISESTARLVKTAFKLNSLGKITVKGKTDPINVYEVLESKTAPESKRGFEELDSPLVGRAGELAEILQALQELCRGHGQIVAVLGEAGIGKTRLVEEASRITGDLGSRADKGSVCKLNWIEGRALSYGFTLPFWTISQLIKHDLGLSDADPEPRIRVALGRRIEQLFGNQAEQVLPYLSRLLGIRLAGEEADRINILDGETLKRQTLIAITQYFEKLAFSAPTVAMFEDLHWADPSSLEALELLLAVTDRAPLMVLLLSRLERGQASWRIKLKAETDYAHRYTEIPLKPLLPEQQNQLVDNLLRIANLPDGLRLLIREHAEGNPLYLEEIVRSLIEQGAIVQEGNHWQATREIADITIPDTLQGVLLARLDRLQEDVRRTLQLASVIGKTFLYSILQAIGEAEQKLDENLAQLQRVDLVREKARVPDLEYMFKHSLTQEAAYSSLLVTRRREFHRKVGEALEKLFPERVEEFYGILAHHFESAGENKKAVDYLVRAGDKARMTAEIPEAIGYYQRLVPLLSAEGDMERLAQVWLKLGLVYCTTFQFDEAYQANERAFTLQKQVATHRIAPPRMKPGLLRISKTGSHITLDPGVVTWENDFRIVNNLFAGLVQIDAELNVVPDLARSWQVLDGGRRYVFILRDGLYWSDGSTLTAKDFEYAWKRNLRPDNTSSSAHYLFDILGAVDYYYRRNLNPDGVGVHALDEYMLEVQLAEPVAYFLFALSMPVAFPLPKNKIESFGDDWWHPENIVCNGPFRLIKFDARHGSTLERNPYYYGEFPGNIQYVKLILTKETSQVGSLYDENSTDLAFQDPFEIHKSTPRDEIQIFTHPRTNFIILGPKMVPLDDVRIRRALSLTINREVLSQKFGLKCADGGLVPPGMPGHSPNIGLSFDLYTARHLLAEAGYPEGKGLPAIKGIARSSMIEIADEIARQWRDYLGVDVSVEPKDQHELVQLAADNIMFHFFLSRWMTDYPDPDNILCQEDAFLFIAYRWGWNDIGYNKLVLEAGRTANQKRRMEMYRQADRMLVQEQVLIIPIDYGGSQIRILVKPWVKNLKITPTGRILIKDILVEDH